MTIEELKKKDDYSFECYMTKEEYNDVWEGECWDEWGCAGAWLGDIGVEYNFCIDDTTHEAINECAIYLTKINEEDYVETDYGMFIHYEINFNNENWKEELENAMCDALIKFFKL